MLEVAGVSTQIRVVAGNAEQPQADDQHAGNRPAFEGDVQSRSDATPRRLRRTHVGTHRDVHTDETGGPRKHSANHETDGHQLAEENPDQHRQHEADDADGRVLPVQVSGGADLHGPGDLLHALVTGGKREYPAGHYGAVENGDPRTNKRKQEP